MSETTKIEKFTFQELVARTNMGSGANSLQFQFAKLQMVLAELNKSEAMERINEVSKAQDQCKALADAITQATSLKATGIFTSDANFTTDRTHIEQCKAVKKVMEDNGLEYDARDNKVEAWENNINRMKNLQERLGADVQTKMVFIQDYMGQYNAYLTGASTAIQQANQTLQTIVRGQ